MATAQSRARGHKRMKRTRQLRFSDLSAEWAAATLPNNVVVIDTKFRMLQPHELAAAMSFPKDYYFHGKREDKVKQIGNAVAGRVAEALITALLS